MLVRFILALGWAIQVGLAAADALSSADLLLRPRRLPVSSKLDTIPVRRRSVTPSGIQQRDTVTYENTSTLDISFENTMLFSFAEAADGEAASGDLEASSSIEITCQMCYIKGDVLFQATEDKPFNFTQYLDEVGQEIEDLAVNITDYVEEYFKNFVFNRTNDLGDFLDAFPPPTLPFDFNLDIPDIPEYNLRLQFDGLELYIQLATKLSSGASYTLNLYSSDTPIGVAIGNDLDLGAVLKVDLVLDVDSEIDITNGFHIKLDDGVIIDIPLFSPEVASITFNGGQFEFLPVTIQSSDVVLKATLRVGVFVGVDVTAYDVLGLIASAGAGASIFVNIAEFTTNVTAPTDDERDTCAFHVVESYQLALGAEAGMSVALGANTWGPTPETDIPLWYTTLPRSCGQSTPTTTDTASEAVTARAITPRAPQDDEDDSNESLTTITTTTELVFTGVSCISAPTDSLISTNCPVSLQSTTKYTTTQTLTTTVSAGGAAAAQTAFPPSSTRNMILSPIAFGSKATVYALVATTGQPVSYEPPKPTSSSSSSSPGDSGSGSVGGASSSNETSSDDHKAIILGVTLGVGVPLLFALTVVLYMTISKRRRSESAYVAASTTDSNEDDTNIYNNNNNNNNNKKNKSSAIDHPTTVSVTETAVMGRFYHDVHDHDRDHDAATAIPSDRGVPLLLKKQTTTDTVTAVDDDEDGH